MSLPYEGPTVLLVDDDPDLREMYGLYLVSEGYGVLQAPNGHAALDVIATTHPDVVVTDIQMPRMNGLQLTHTLRSRPATARVPVIGLSGLGGFEAAAVAAGCNAILEKPCAPEVLAALVARVLQWSHTVARRAAELRAEARGLRQHAERLRKDRRAAANPAAVPMRVRTNDVK
jgi:CheY-like chemotaxis protein